MFLVVENSIPEKKIDDKVSLKAAKKADEKKKKEKDATKGKEKSRGKAKVEEKEEEDPSARPKDEVVVYSDIDFTFREVEANGNQILIGPSRLTRFEQARITGARSLQLSLGAPSLIRIPNDVRDSITLAKAELDQKALPISIRRVLPNGLYQDIPIQWTK